MTTRFQRFAIFGLVLLFAALALIVLLPTAAHAQEAFTPSAADLTVWAGTPGLDETAPAPVVTVPDIPAEPEPLPDVTSGVWNPVVAIVVGVLVVLGSITGVSVHGLANSVPGKLLLTTGANIAARTPPAWDDQAVNAAVAAGKLKIVIRQDGWREIVPLDYQPPAAG